MSSLREGTFYPVWPHIDAKPINFQWGEIRKNTSEAKGLVRNTWLDYDDSLDTLNAEKVLSGFNFGDTSFRNRYRLIYRKADKQLCVQKNDGTEEIPDWKDCWCIRWTDGQFRVESEGGIYTSTGFYGTLPPDIIEKVGEAGAAGGTEFEDVSKLFFNSDQGFYLSSIKSGVNAGSPLVNQAYAYGRSRQYTGSGNRWAIEHNFGTSQVMVQVTDNSDRIIIPDTVDISNPNTAYFYFDSSFSGKVIISTGGMGTEAFPDEFLPFDLADGSEQTLYLDPSAKVGYNVIDVTSRTESGTATVGFYIRGALGHGHGISVAGMDPVSVTATPVTSEATYFYPTGLNNTVAQTDELIMFVAEASSAVHLRGNVRIRRT